MTKQDKEDYIQGAIGEVLRISKLFDNNITLTQYEDYRHPEYRFEAIRHRLKWGFNDLKKAAGLTVSTRGGARKAEGRKPKITERVCNMCSETFKAVDFMRSCPACHNLKNYSGGDSLSGGMDEFNLGYI